MICNSFPGALADCPASHPFAYYKGDYCCLYPMERSGCSKYSGDNSYLDLRSGCCYDDKYLACDQKPCGDYLGN